MNRRTTYTFKWPGRKKPNGLAMNCHMKDGQLRFFDTNRGHMIDGKVTKDGDIQDVIDQLTIAENAEKLKAAEL